MGAAHRRLLSYAKEIATGGEAARTVPPCAVAAVYMLNAGPIFMTIFQIAKATFMSDKISRRTFPISGDPFANSVDFAARFDRSILPAAVGGSLVVGTARVATRAAISCTSHCADHRVRCRSQDAHCCCEVELPALNDADALWSYYEGP